MTTTETHLDPIQRARKADPRIKALDLVVTALATAAQHSAGPNCSGCTWTRIIKPLATPLIGWERGYPPAEAKDPSNTLLFVNVAELMAQMDEQKTRRTPVTTDTERWLRTTEAWDAVTDAWLARLDAADPGTGHGITCASA